MSRTEKILIAIICVGMAVLVAHAIYDFYQFQTALEVFDQHCSCPDLSRYLEEVGNGNP